MAKHCLVALIVGLLSVWMPLELRAERPTAPKLLPESTLAYVRVHKMPELVDSFQRTSIGRLANDEKIRPLLGQLYGSLAEAFGPVEDRIGLSLTELLAIPQGEVCLAFISPEVGDPAAVALLEVAEQLPAAEKLLGRFHEELMNNGAKRREEKVGDTTMQVFRFPNSDENELVQFDRDGTFVFASNLDVAKELLAVWEGKEVQTLADNRRFVTIMRRCAGTAEERPQLSWYVDPIGIAKRLGRGNLGAQAGLALLEPLGLDGLKAVGGSVYFAGEEFDAIVHTHLMLGNPREGVIKVLALQPGDMTPEPWVPNDVATYTTLHWNFDESFTTIDRLYDLLRGEGRFEELVQAGSDRIGVDIKTDLVDALDGRVTAFNWMQKPVTLNSQTTTIGLKLKDAERFEETLEKLMEQFGNRFEKDNFRGVKFYRFLTPNADERPSRALIRQPKPCLAIVGDYLIGTDSVDVLKQTINAKGRTNNSLANELDYKLIASKIARHSKAGKPAMISFQRPEESLRWVYELATADTTRSTLNDAADNPVLGPLNRALNDNPLPPFADLARYLAPGGSMVVSDETGIHYMSFGLKRDMPASQPASQPAEK